MTDRFLRCIPLILAHEGGYVDHPRDPGGCTNRGITRATLEGWRRVPTNCAAVRALGEAEARAIYRTHYWNAVRGDDLPAGLDLVLFDAAVNSGRRRSVEWVQMALGVQADGALGPKTLGAIRRVNDLERLIIGTCSARLDFLESLSTWPVFGKGWGARVTKVRQDAIAMMETVANSTR